MSRLNFPAFLARTILRVAFFSIALGTWVETAAQEGDLYKLPDDTAKVNRIIVYARQLQNSQPEATGRLIDVALQISEKLHYDLGLATAYVFKAGQYCNRMELDSARIYNDKALKYITETQSLPAKNQLAAVYNNYGVIYQQRQLYDSAAGMYLQVVKLCDETGNHYRKTVAFFNLSVIYSFIRDTLKTDRYARLSVAESGLAGDTTLILRTSIILLNSFANYHQYDSILPYARPALELARKKNDFYSQAKMLLFIGDYYKEKRMWDSAHIYVQQSLRLVREINNPYDIAIVLFEIGNTYISQEEYAKAIPYLEEALKIENDGELLQLKTETLKSLAEAEAKSGRVDKAFSYLEEYVTVNDSLTKKTNEEAVQMLEIRYQLQNKENTIALQKADIKQKRTINYILFGAAAALLIIFLLAYRNHRHRRTLQQAKIDELEAEKQLTATEAVLKGEEQERTRLAKDLHDGLGGMLSGIKFSLSNMKDNLIMTPDNAQAFERSIDMLDSSIKEMRRVAHNMMPEMLVKYGLDTALKEFCNETDRSGALHASYQSVGMGSVEIDQTTSVTVYRIVQELVNNVIKHAQAKNVLVQLHHSSQEKILAVTVEDDGRGFDVNALKNAEGMGWRSIQNRVEFLKGKADVQSSPNNGTSVMIEITI